MKFTTLKLARAGVMASLYCLLSLVTFPVASGIIQFRLSEALTILPLLYFEAVPALFIGCALTNIITGCVVYDVVFGSLITLVASTFTFLMGKIFKKTWLKYVLGGIFPVLLNAFLLPLIWFYCYGKLEFMYIVQVAFLIISQGVSVYALGLPLCVAVKKLKEKNLPGFID